MLLKISPRRRARRGPRRACTARRSWRRGAGRRSRRSARSAAPRPPSSRARASRGPRRRGAGSIHVGSHPASRSATARAANRFPRARSSEVDAHASRTTYPSRRMRSRESLESAAATSSSRDGATRPPSRTPSASSNRRHASRSATVSGERGGANAGGDIARSARAEDCEKARFRAAGRDDAKRRERKRKRVVVGNYNRETVFVSKCEVVSRARRVRASER